MASHSSTLAWKIPWMEEPGGLQSMGSLRVGHDRATSLSLFTFKHWRRKWQPTPVFLPGESQGRGAWWAAVYGLTQSRRRLKWLNSSSSNRFVTEFHVMSIFTSLMYNDADHLFLYASLSSYIFFGEESVQMLWWFLKLEWFVFLLSFENC